MAVTDTILSGNLAARLFTGAYLQDLGVGQLGSVGGFARGMGRL